jgi:hypothetical protein
MKLKEILGGTLNIGILTIFYTLFGALISYLIFHLFDDHTDEWEKSSALYQFTDVTAELSLIGIIAYWTTHIIREHPPIFPISRELDRVIDTYVSGIFFAFAMFLFLEDLSTKIKFLYERYLKSHFVKVIPEDWSIIEALFGKRKTNTPKSRY